MLKLAMPAATVALLATAWVLLPMQSDSVLAQSPPAPQAPAAPAAPPAPQPAAPAPAVASGVPVPPAVPPAPPPPPLPTPSPSFYVNAADIDVAPAMMSKFMADLNADVASTIKETGCQELDITISQSDPSHVLIFEAYTNAAAWGSHQLSSYFLKFYGLTAQMMTTLNIRPFSSIAMGGKAPAAAGLFVSANDLDIAPAQFNAFMVAAKTNGAAMLTDPVAREFDISVLQQDPHHVLLFEVYDTSAAMDADRATDHYKAFDAATKGMITNQSSEQATSVSMYKKSK